MSLLNDALRAGVAPARPQAGPAPGHLLVAGGAGPLGSAVLEQALASGHWTPVSALVTQPIEVALRGLHAILIAPDLSGQLALRAADTAIIVFDRERSRHGREAAFLKPQPDQLPLLARRLHEHGVRRLVLVLPHAPSLLPQALKAGLANLDERAVAALGFEQLVVVRPTRAGGDTPAAAPVDSSAEKPNAFLTWLARGILSQLSLMVPQRDQPLRAAKVAQFVIALAQALPQSPAGTRVAPHELLWDWAQGEGGDALLQSWLQHGHWAPVAASIRRY